jgi:hypothetical protein
MCSGATYQMNKNIYCDGYYKRLRLLCSLLLTKRYMFLVCHSGVAACMRVEFSRACEDTSGMCNRKPVWWKITDMQSSVCLVNKTFLTIQDFSHAFGRYYKTPSIRRQAAVARSV